MKKSVIRLLMCAILFAGCFSSSIPVNAKMGVPDVLADYMEAHGMDWMNLEDGLRASLATGINSDGSPMTEADRRQIEAKLGISSSAPAASGGQTSKPAAAAPKHEHSYQEEVTKEATCTEAGETEAGNAADMNRMTVYRIATH